MGNGTIAGAATVAGGTVSPGTSIGNLNFAAGLALQPGSTLLMELDRSLSPAATNDTISVSGVFTAGGTLTVVNLGPALSAGNKFKLFTSAVFGFSTVNLPPSYTWQNDLAVDGSITVTGVAGSPLLEYSQSGGNLNFNWTPFSGYKLQAQTNALTVGIQTNPAAWFDYPGGTTPPVSVPIGGGNPAVFFRLKTIP
jgi:hypothetical protein